MSDHLGGGDSTNASTFGELVTSGIRKQKSSRK